MRLLLIIILGVFIVTYSWGWLTRVGEGQMDTKAYTELYNREVQEQFRYFLDDMEKLIEFLKKPLPQAQVPQF